MQPVNQVFCLLAVGVFEQAYYKIGHAIILQSQLEQIRTVPRLDQHVGSVPLTPGDLETFLEEGQGLFQSTLLVIALSQFIVCVHQQVILLNGTGLLQSFFQ